MPRRLFAIMSFSETMCLPECFRTCAHAGLMRRPVTRMDNRDDEVHELVRDQINDRDSPCGLAGGPAGRRGSSYLESRHFSEHPEVLWNPNRKRVPGGIQSLYGCDRLR